MKFAIGGLFGIIDFSTVTFQDVPNVVTVIVPLKSVRCIDELCAISLVSVSGAVSGGWILVLGYFVVFNSCVRRFFVKEHLRG